jgi:hypothetical protein
VGLATTVRTVGVVLIAVVGLWLLLRRPDGRDWAAWRRSLLPGVAMVVVSGAIVLAYAGWHDSSAGGFELTTNGNYILYGRVAPWADCHDFTPPAGTSRLCEQLPPDRRPGAGVYLFGGSPAVKAFGFAGLPLAPASAQKLKAFSVAALEHQPLTYLWTIAEKFLRVVSPGVGTPGEGQTPSTFLPYISDSGRTALNAPVARAMYGGRAEVSVASSAAALEAYDSRTHADGLFMALLIVLAVMAPFVASRHGPRRRAVLVSVFAFALLLTPLATVDYDYRYVIPAIGPLAAAAAVGAGGVWCRWIARPGAPRPVVSG